MLGEEVWEAIENIIRVFMVVAWIRDWWQEYGRKQLAQSFVRKVDSLGSLSDRDVKSELSSVFTRSGS